MANDDRRLDDTTTTSSSMTEEKENLRATATTTAKKQRNTKQNLSNGNIGNKNINTNVVNIQELISKMSLEDKIGQMSQIDLSLLFEDEDGGSDDETNKSPKQISSRKIEHYFGKLGIGSLLNTIADEYWNATQYRDVAIKIQQITTKYKRPPVIWGLDSVHGANYIHGAVVTPQPINIAATFNKTISKQAGQIASRDTKSAGINWLFSPLLGISIEPKWSRVYETFGEDPFLVTEMSLFMIVGIQEVDEDTSNIPSRAAACAKHYIGYSASKDGHDRAPSWIPKRHLYNYFVPPWRVALKEALTVMESYSEADGVPNVANKQTLHKLLRYTLNYTDGLLVTDFEEIYNLHDWHHIVSSKEEAVIHSLREGTVDMSMIPFDIDTYRESIMTGIKSNKISIERINKSVERVLLLKSKLNMFSNDEVMTMENNDNIAKVGTDRQEVLDMIHQSIVLTKNSDNILPLDIKKELKIHITGPSSNSLSYQSGGWTWQWQGAPDTDNWFTYGSSVANAIAIDNNSTTSWDVTVSCGVDILGNECNDTRLARFKDSDDDEDDNTIGEVISTVSHWIGLDKSKDFNDLNSIDRSSELSKQADVTIICIGEESYTEKPGDIRSLQLAKGQYKLVQSIKEKSLSSSKLIVIYFGGRPRLLHDISDIVDAIFVGFLPGPDAGQAIFDLLTGKVNPSGRLPITYPKYEDGAGVPYFHAVSDQCTASWESPDDDTKEPLPHYKYVPQCDVQWPFGYGLSYTTFEYTNLKLSTDTLRYKSMGQNAERRNNNDNQEETLTISVTVKNTGQRAGSESVLFFTFDESRHVTPEYKRLRSFTKVYLQPGHEKVVTATIDINDPAFQFIGPHDDTHLILQNEMKFRVGVGVDAICRGEDDEDYTPKQCSDYVTIDTGHDYIAACDVACRVWVDSACTDELNISPTQCWTMCTTDSSNLSLSNMELNTDGWGWNYVNCIESVVYETTTEFGSMENQCWRLNTLCRDVLARTTTDNMVNMQENTALQTSSPYRASSILVALLAGVIGTALILFMFRGGIENLTLRRGRKRSIVSEVQFSIVGNADDDTQQQHSIS